MGAPFNSILCGVEGNPASTEAARQAIALAGEDTRLHFTAVYTSFELGPDYHKDALEKSLEEAAVLAGDAGVSASYNLREARYAIDVLLSESKEHEVLHVDDGKHQQARPVVEEQVEELRAMSGTAPELTTHEGNVTKEIVEVAKDSGASLIVTGRRGLKGLKSLGSVSERIVSGAHCSVLLVPAGERT
jgi:nucleotide-binding universal stress UspA family protein